MNIAEQLRAARGILDWNQQDLADHSRVSKSAIVNIEQGKVEPELATLRKLTRALEKEGVLISPSAVQKMESFTVEFGSYLEVLEDIEQTLPDGGEVRVHCADDRKSSDAVNQKLQELRAKGIQFRITICEGNSFIVGDMNDYRWLDKEYFGTSEVTVIYANKVVFHLMMNAESKFLAIVNDRYAKRERSTFDYWWNKSKMVGDDGR